MSIVFADVSGFGAMTEGEVHAFSETLLPQCTRLARTHETAYCNTWGDAIVAYFGSVDQALTYALELRDTFRNRNWSGSAEDPYVRPLKVRIALHTADVFVSEDDSVPGGQVFGTQVSLAARIEPITTPNEVFATEVAVAALKSTGRAGVSIKKLGVVTLPKEKRRETLYWIRRTGETASRGKTVVLQPPPLRTLASTEEAIAEIKDGERVRSLRVLGLNGGSSMHSLLAVAERTLAAKAQISIVMYDPDFARLVPPAVVDAAENGFLQSLYRKASRGSVASRAATEYVMQASELGAWSSESQEAQLSRLCERLRVCLREAAAPHVSATLLKSARWVPARCWIVDQRAYVTSYWQPNALSPILVAEAGHPLYEAVVRHFDYVWSEALESDASVLLTAESPDRPRKR